VRANNVRAVASSQLQRRVVVVSRRVAACSCCRLRRNIHGYPTSQTTRGRWGDQIQTGPPLPSAKAQMRSGEAKTTFFVGVQRSAVRSRRGVRLEMLQADPYAVHAVEC